jgi:uncharacterized phage protein (TIGR02220 family)
VRNFIIPEVFFKSIAEKEKLYSRIWFYWLSEFADEILEKEFIEGQRERFPKISEIREIYEFGLQFLQQDFKIVVDKSKKKPQKPIPREHRKIAEQVLDYLNQEAETNFISKGTNLDLVSARLTEGFILSDFKTVIDKKVKDWKGTDWAKYLRPLTLFSKSKFENYLNSNNEPRKQDINNFTRFAQSVAKAKQFNPFRKDE